MLVSFFSLFTPCLRPRSTTPLADTQVDTGYRVSGCVFCDVSKERGFDVVWEDDAFVAFNDRSPAAAQHMLVIPKRHVESAKTLKPQDASMVERMAEIGHALLDDLAVPPDARRLGFHIPPFNSVDHLHLHVQSLPYRSAWRRAKYPRAPGRQGKAKGFGWFVEVGQVVKILEGGGSVGVMPC